MARKKSVTKLFREPPPAKRRKALNVEIDSGLNIRLKTALLYLEGEGVEMQKYAFVEQLLKAGLDRFDEEHGGRK